MTNKQKIEANISRIDKILDEDFITIPVKEILTEIKSELKTIASNL